MQAAKEYMLCCKDDNGPQRILAKLTAWLHAQTSFPEVRPPLRAYPRKRRRGLLHVECVPPVLT